VYPAAAYGSFAFVVNSVIPPVALATATSTLPAVPHFISANIHPALLAMFFAFTTAITKLGEHPNPNGRTKSKSKCRKYRRRANQIKSNGAPAKKKENQIQIKYRPRKHKWDQMAARESPAIWGLTAFKPHKNRRAWQIDHRRHCYPQPMTPGLSEVTFCLRV
jgi:hypothetical protein